MKRIILAVFSLTLLLARPGFAGGDHEKCTMHVKNCLNTMVMKLKKAGFIGVELDQCKKTGALTVTNVIEGSPAEKAGIQVGDELYALNGVRFNKENHDAISKVKLPGKKVTCTVKRNGANKKFKLTLVPMPADLMAKYIGEHMMEHATASDSLAKK